MELKDKYKILEQKVDEIRVRETKELGQIDLDKIQELDNKWEEYKSNGLKMIEDAYA